MLLARVASLAREGRIVEQPRGRPLEFPERERERDEEEEGDTKNEDFFREKEKLLTSPSVARGVRLERQGQTGRRRRRPETRQQEEEKEDDDEALGVARKKKREKRKVEEEMGGWRLVGIRVVSS